MNLLRRTCGGQRCPTSGSIPKIRCLLHLDGNCSRAWASIGLFGSWFFLFLANKSLAGTLPPEISNLRVLSELYLSRSQITGINNCDSECSLHIYAHSWRSHDHRTCTNTSTTTVAIAWPLSLHRDHLAVSDAYDNLWSIYRKNKNKNKEISKIKKATNQTSIKAFFSK